MWGEGEPLLEEGAGPEALGTPDGSLAPRASQGSQAEGRQGRLRRGGPPSAQTALGGRPQVAATAPSAARSSAYDARLRQKVAVKKLSRPFQSLVHARRTYRELRLLQHLKHENVSGAPGRGGAGLPGGRGPRAGPNPTLTPQVIGLLDVFTPATSIEDFSEV